MDRFFNRTSSQETGDHLISSTYSVTAPKDFDDDCEIVYQNNTAESSLQSRENWENNQTNKWKTSPASISMSVNDILQLAFASSKICAQVPETTLTVNQAASTEKLHEYEKHENYKHYDHPTSSISNGSSSYPTKISSFSSEYQQNCEKYPVLEPLPGEDSFSRGKRMIGDPNYQGYFTDFFLQTGMQHPGEQRACIDNQHDYNFSDNMRSEEHQFPRSESMHPQYAALEKLYKGSNKVSYYNQLDYTHHRDHVRNPPRSHFNNPSYNRRKYIQRGTKKQSKPLYNHQYNSHQIRYNHYHRQQREFHM